MNISKAVLSRFINIPNSEKDLRNLLDDIGIEVKRIEQGSAPHLEGDSIFGVELLANRGDHYCYSGIAREISGRPGSTLCGPKHEQLQVGSGPSIRIETDLCLLYSLTLLERQEKEQASFPSEILRPLHAAGIHSLVPPVDATNLSNLELGQPTHVFDADKVVGTVVVRLSTQGEQAWPLFKEEKIELPQGIMVIADDEKILAIAGVIGCEDSKTTAQTRRILLESACFDPVSVRKAGRALNIHTDSLARFERGSDPLLPLIGAGRVVYLLELYSGWKRSSQTSLDGDWMHPLRTLEIEPLKVNQFLDVQLKEEEIVERLTRYGFTCRIGANSTSSIIDVIVPPHRLWDVDCTADLYEELAKSIGYNSTPISLPSIDKGALVEAERQVREKVEQVILGEGFYEVITDGFYGRSQHERLNLPEDHILQRHVETQNALDRGYSLLKNNCFLHALEAVALNLNQGVAEVKMYEWTRVFLPDQQAENGVCTEQKMIWMATSGSRIEQDWSKSQRAADLFFLKGVLNEISIQLGLKLELDLNSKGSLSLLLHPYRQALIRLDGTVVGQMGELHPQILRSYKIKRLRPCYLELREEALSKGNVVKTYRSAPQHQDLERTITFALPLMVHSQSIVDILSLQGAEVSIVDRFDFQDGENQKRAMTYSLAFPNPDGERTADSVNQILQECIQAVHEQYGHLGVVQR